MLYILFAILFFGFLIAIHEFGHFLTAKLCRVRVNEFSIGMGPLLLKKQGKETLYSLRLLPIGGFCAMEGEDEATDDPRSFAKAPAWRRFLILVAGSGMNFLAGMVILLLLLSPAQAATTAVIDSFEEGCPAAEQGYLQPGDEILRINGHLVLIYDDISMLLARGNGETADLVVRRDGERVKLEDVPMALAEYEQDGVSRVRYGINFSVQKSGFFRNVDTALRTSLDFVRLVWFGLEDLFSGAAGLKEMSGPIGIVDAMSDVGQSSASPLAALLNLLYFGAFIAINLAVMNLLPVPALDGGRIFFLIINVILARLVHRQIPGKYEGYVHLAGMALLLLLMLVVGINDVFRLIGS